MHPDIAMRLITRSIFITSSVLYLFHICEKDRKAEGINKLLESGCIQSFQIIT